MLKSVAKKLGTTRVHVSKEWARYRKVKKKLLGRRLATDLKKQVLTSELDITRTRISKVWTGYKEKKYSILHTSPYSGFDFTSRQVGVEKELFSIDKKTKLRVVKIDEKTGKPEKRFFRFAKIQQKIYKARKGFDVDRLDTIVPQILDENNVKGILLVFEIFNKETDSRQIISNYITKDLYDIMQELDETVFEYITGRFQGYGEYELKFIYMRVVYSKG